MLSRYAFWLVPLAVFEAVVKIGIVDSLEGTDQLPVVAARTGANPGIDLQTGAKVSGTYLDSEAGADLGPAVRRGPD